ncbi:type I DNA topoisomerase [Candidatus Gracilibacteria bacterium]|nr:type I DNA topoisomerase [Candidatus Gracilibacteria bacterium]
MDNLVIVESPAKSQTIKKFLGEGFEVKASMGHIVDLPTKEMAIDIKNNFIPQYVVSPDKQKTLKELKSIASKVKKVWIATDEDREGEAIGRHVATQLGLNIANTSRIVFHEITKDAIDHAIKNPRTIDMNLVDAQQARRVLDRLVGYELSPVLRQKIKRGLSAGRVQSVAVRLLVEREREIQKFESESFFKVIGNFIGDEKKEFKAELSKDIKDTQETEKFLNDISNSNFQISKIEVKPGKKTPSAPFTTSTLQQEASRKLGFSVARTMQVAQKLYEAGHITYMRTDSVNISQSAMQAAQNEIKKIYGDKYSSPTNYKTKTKGSQEAHECIRPSHMENPHAGSDSSEKKLYDLIWKRTIASQMSPAIVEKTKATIDISGNKNKFIATGEVIKFDGFLKVYFESRDDDEEEDKGILPKLTEGEILNPTQIIATQRFKNHPPRYTEASLVKKLEEQGIGRPSTYAPTISTIQKRGYVIKEDRPGEKREYIEFILENSKITQTTKEQNTGAEKNKLFPTDIGMVVTDFLMEHFSNIIDYNFTAGVEEEFDNIAEGKIQRSKMIGDFYGPFHDQISKTAETDRVNSDKEIGLDPQSGKKVIARIGRFGPMLQIGEVTDEEKPKFAPMPSGKTIETITLPEALKAFSLPRDVGTYKGEKVIAGIGRFGPYLKYKSLFVSIPKTSGLDPFTIGIEDSKELVEKKIEAEKNKHINSFPHDGKTIEVLNGFYGPYIKYDGNNYRLVKGGKDASDLNLEDCLVVIEAKIGKNPQTKKKASKPKISKTATKAKKAKKK